MRQKRAFMYTGVMVCSLLTFISALFIGRYMISPLSVIEITWEVLSRSGVSSDPQAAAVIIGLRLPRAILCIIVGGGMAVAGTTYQGLFRNPLVSPDILGVSSGAGFGAALSILTMGVSGFSPVFSIGFGMLSVVMTYFLARVRREVSTLSLVLAGMVVSSIFTSLISLVKYVADPYDQLPAITYWLMGSFSKTTFGDVRLILVPISLSIAILFALRWRLNIMSLGDDEAKNLGVNPVSTRLVMIGLSTVITSLSVTVVGIVGWVGLIIPHVARFIVGVDHRHTLPMSFLIGGIFLTWVDILARTMTPMEIPIGILTALVGAPFFAVLFKHLQKDKGVW